MKIIFLRYHRALRLAILRAIDQAGTLLLGAAIVAAAVYMLVLLWSLPDWFIQY